MNRSILIGLFLLGLSMASSGIGLQACVDRDGDGFSVGVGCGVQDCNDPDAAINPGAVEVCNGLDDDCNGFVDDSLSCDRTCDNPEVMPFTQRVSLDNSVSSRRPSLVWVGDGWIAAWDQVTDGSCSEGRIQRLDPAGQPVGSPMTFVGGGGEKIQVLHIALAWNGTELAIAWQEVPINETCFSIAGQFHDYVQLFDSAFQPLTLRRQLDCGEFDSANPPEIAWGRSRFGLVWPDDALQFSTVDRDGFVAVACGQTIGPPVIESTQGRNPGIEWNGEYFGIVWEDAEPNTNGFDIFQEVYFRRVDENDVSPDIQPMRITYDPDRSEYSSLTWSDGEWGVTWADTRDNPGLNKNEIYLARLNPIGTKVDPPGDIRVSCCNTATEGDARSFNTVAWTGEEYGIAYLDQNHPTDVTGDLFFQRSDAAGVLLGNPVLVTTDSKLRAFFFDMVWNGESYGIAFDDQPPGLLTRQILFTTVGCNCTDADGDQFTTCAGGDCLDDDPLSNPLAVESCLDGKDNNCDGPIDCQDTETCTASSGTIPGELQGLMFGGDKQTLSWQADPDSDVYDLLTGKLDELHLDGDFTRATCLVWRQPGTTYVAVDLPVPGDGLYYLVRGKADRCKLGTWGSALRDEARLTCP